MAASIVGSEAATAPSEVGVAPSATPWFEEVGQASGVDFVHTHGGTTPIVIYEQIPPGAAWVDYDADGDLDLFTVQSGHRRDAAPVGQALPTHRLFRNEGTDPRGGVRFLDVTRVAGVAGAGYGMGVVAADLDNDGDQDLYVTSYGPNTLFLNRGDGTFVDSTAAAGVGDDRMSMSAAAADVDGDGLLDLYVVNYIDFEAGPEFCFYNGIKAGCSDLKYPGVPNTLYLNLGPGDDGVPRFREAAKERGILDAHGRGLGTVFGDLDGDGDIDLYVANDGGGNRVFLNDGRGFFQDYTLMSGAGYSEAGLGQAGMGTDLGDFDGDGQLDIFVTNFARETNALYRNDGSNLFSYRTVAAGMSEASFLPLGWGTRFFDADLDGYLDLFVANGHVYDVCELINPQDRFAQKNQLFLNRRDGTFADVSADAGPGLALTAVSRGAAFGDIDRDGDTDIYVANNGEAGDLLLNQTPRDGRHSISVALRGSPSNRDALGARVTVKAGGQTHLQEVRAGGSYLSDSDRWLLFGLGTAARVDTIEVRWPSGTVHRIHGLPADLGFQWPERRTGS